MHLILVDGRPDTKASLLARISEAMRQADLRGFELVELTPAEVSNFEWAQAAGCIVGPGCYDDLEEVIESIRAVFPEGATGIALETETYNSEAMLLRKKVRAHIMPMGDLVQIAAFLIDCEAASTRKASGGTRTKGIIGFCHFKGGVGCSSLAAAFASCWARHGLSVAAVDLDDVNPQLTAWARVGVAQRTVVAELLRQGEVPASRINELVHPVEGFEGRLVMVGQPDAYNEAFHFKANVLEGSPSASEFMTSLITNLQGEFDAIVIDLSRSWGVSTFACLPFCQHIVLVTDDDGMSVRRSLDCLDRLRKETDDSSEFDFAKWSLILNAFTGKLISPKEIAVEIQEMELFSAHSSLFTVPFTETGRQWGAPGQSLYDTADARTQKIIRKVAYSLIPFRYETDAPKNKGLIKKLQSFVGASS